MATGTYTYALGEFITVQSDVEVFLFDVPAGAPVADPDIVIRKVAERSLAVEQRDGRFLVTVPPSVPTIKTTAAEP